MIASLLALLLACADPAPAPTHEPSTASTPAPPLPEPAAPLIYRPTAVQGGVQIWLADGAGPAVMDHSRRRWRLRPPSGEPLRARKRWSDWDRHAAPCLDDPWGESLERSRRLVLLEERPGEQRWWWWLQLSGRDRCGIEGEAWLSVERDQVRLGGLRFGGLPWDEGGRAAARESAALWIQDNAEQLWLEGDDADRILLLRTLREARDPGADDALQRLLPIAGIMRPDVQRSIEARAEGPAPPPE